MSDKLFDRYLPMVERELERILPSGDGRLDAVLCSAMRYAVLNGGKRIRPVLALAFCHACGGNPESALPFACAVELVHSYSLVHDDLPCMDDDDLRRGKPSCHKVYGEAMALLAGDALLAKAFEAVFSGAGCQEDALASAQAGRLLAQLAGCDGMVGGQVIDLLSEEKQAGVEVLRKMDEGKTVALISAACQMGCIAAGAPTEYLAAAKRYADGIGLAFQITDDILDVTGTTQELGKTVGSDKENGKSTYVSLLGIEKARELAGQLTRQAVEALACFGENGTLLADLAMALAERKK